MRPAAPSRRDLLLSSLGLLVTGVAHADVGTHDVCYGTSATLQPLVARYATVKKMLGPDVTRQLVVVRRSDSELALVYLRGGDLTGTRSVAARHARLLASSGVKATAVPSGGAIVYPPSRVTAEAPAELMAANVAAPAPAAPPSSDASELERAIEAHVKRLREAGRVAGDEGTSWLVHDLDGDRELASINAEVPRQAASMIKPLVMLAFFHQVAAGRIVYGSGSRGRLEAMIQQSSNTSTNWTIDTVGGPSAVQAVLKGSYGALLPGTTVVERIPSGGRTYRNKASAGDYGRYLRALWRDEVPYADEQRRILGLPNRDRLYHGAESIPSGTVVLDKTGSTSRCCGDIGIVIARKRSGGTFPYVFCGVIEKARSTTSYSAWISARSNVIRDVSDLTYRHLRPVYGLS